MARDPFNAQQYNKAWELAHREERLAYKADYRATHREEIHAYDEAHRLEKRLYHKQHYATHREEKRQKAAEYKKLYPEKWLASRRKSNAKRREIMRLWRETHTEEMSIYHREYRLSHPEKFVAARQKRRALKSNAPLNDFTAVQWVAMQAAYDHRCVYCGKRAKGHLTQDHLTPLSKGGNHTYSNILPACRSCNSKKHTGAVLKPVQPLLFLVA